MKILLNIVIILSQIAASFSHSWVECTDYKVANPSQTPPLGLKETDPARKLYNSDLCSGYPRDWPTHAQRSSAFGQDTGFNYHPTENAACPSAFGQAGDYSTEFPMAEYTAGQTVCIAYPAKNHAADTCTNPFIPDAGVAIYASGPNPTADKTLSQFRSSGALTQLNGVHVKGVIDFKGYQNCPSFCSNMPNTDRATCTMCFETSSSMEPGEYTFMWFWEFNIGELYTTCWEANVKSGGNPSPTPKSPSSAPTRKPTLLAPSTTPNAPTRKPTSMAPSITPNAPTRNPTKTPTINQPTSSGCSDCSSCVKDWEQCGGVDYSGPIKCCDCMYTCKYKNSYYSQCVPK